MPNNTQNKHSIWYIFTQPSYLMIKLYLWELCTQQLNMTLDTNQWKGEKSVSGINIWSFSVSQDFYAKKRGATFNLKRGAVFPEVRDSAERQLTSVVPLLRGGGQLTDVCCLGSCGCEIKTPARSEPMSAMSAGAPRPLPSSGQKSIQDICHPLSAEESARNPGSAADKVRSGLGLFGATSAQNRSLARQHS